MTVWKLDKNHTEVKFKAKHLVVSTVTGYFNKYDGSVTTNNDDFSDAKIYFEADVRSINTANERRDAHLKSADFFDVENNPKLIFKSKSVKKVSDTEYEITGDMTIRGITKEIKVKAEHEGNTIGLGGDEVAAFEITGKVNRFDFGLKWNALTEAGGVIAGEEIKIDIIAELIKVKEPVKV